MDNTSPTPPKRPRTIDFLTSQLEKPVRYFPFTKKSGGDGTIQQQETLGKVVPSIRSQNAVNSSLSFSSTMKFVPNKEANISNKLQKLKLKSPDGRDLGEINVQLLPQKGNGIGGKTIMLQKHSLFGKLDNPSTVSILKPVEKHKQASTHGSVSILQTQGSFINNGNNCISVSSIRPTNMGRDILNVKPKNESQSTAPMRQRETITRYSNSSLGSKVFFVNVDKQSGLNTVKSVNNDARVSSQPSNQKVIVVHAENYPDSTEGKKNNSISLPIELRIPSASKDDAGYETASSTSNVRTIPSVFWNPTKFSDITSKLSNHKNKVSENEVIGKDFGLHNKQMTMFADSEYVKTAGKSITMGTSSFIKKQKPKLTSWTIVKTCNKKLENSRKGSCEGEIDGKVSPRNGIEISKSPSGQTIIISNLNSENTQSVTSTTNSVLNLVEGKQTDENLRSNVELDKCKNKSSNDQNIRENIMVIVHGDMNTLQNNSKQKESSNETDRMEVDASSANLTTEKEQNTAGVNRDLPSKQRDLEIIQKALSSCMDQDLREKALKALAECGIGVKRDVPISPTISVNDSQTQTAVFSLLKDETLVEYSHDYPTLNELTVLKSNDKSLQMYPNGNNELSLHHPDINNDCFDIDIELDAIDELLSGNSQKEVNQIKDIFSKPDPIVSKAFAQIQKDFEAATTVDANGMMGIHRAVLSGSITEVRRQLIVLKAVKQSIEVPTDDEKTSLELAVLHDAEPCIINALLSAGAKPAFPLKLHESALIIASKSSSTVLPELIKHTTSAELFDIVDSDGFAPLHYCAQHGNTHGVKLLINAGANANLRDAKSGRTALFHALENRHIEIASYLIDNKASPNITNFAGQSAATLVDEYRHNSLAEKFNQAVR